MRSVKRLLGLDFEDQARQAIKQGEDRAGLRTFKTRSDIDKELGKAGIPPAPPRDRG